MTLRIAHITTSDSSLAYLLKNQLAHFREAGYEVAGIAANDGHGHVLPPLGVAFHAIPATRKFAPLADLRALVTLVRLLRRERYDIVHTHTPKGGLLGQYAALLARVPIRVHTIHGLYFPGSMKPERRWIYVLLERLTLAFSHFNYSQNPEDVPVAIAERIVRADRILQIGNGIALARFDPARFSPEARRAIRAKLGLADHHVVIGMVGRLVAEKGYLEAFEAARALRDRHPQARFIFIGGFEDREKPDAIRKGVLAEYGIADIAQLLGHRDDVDELYAAMDIFMLPSHREGFPRSPMEASAMGLPCVVTDIRGCRQTVDHDVTGMMIPLRDPAALAAALERLVRSPDDRARMGRAARAKALAEFDERRIFALLVEEYRRLSSRR